MWNIEPNYGATALSGQQAKITLSACIDIEPFNDVFESHSPLEELVEEPFYAHVGIYAYRKEALAQMASLPASRLELRESLEQLRALENGIPIYAIVRDVETIGVDHPSQVAIVEELMNKKVGKG